MEGWDKDECLYRERWVGETGAGEAGMVVSGGVSSLTVRTEVKFEKDIDLITIKLYNFSHDILLSRSSSQYYQVIHKL